MQTRTTKKQGNSPKCEISQNQLISSAHNLAYDFITWWPDWAESQKFQGICQIYKQAAGTKRFAAIRGFFCQLFMKNHGGDPTPYKYDGITYDPTEVIIITSFPVKLSTYAIYFGPPVLSYGERRFRKLNDYMDIVWGDIARKLNGDWGIQVCV